MSNIKNVSYVVALALLAAATAACTGANERKVSYLHKGEAYFNAQKFDKARVELRNALQIDPKYVEARYLYGRTAERRGDLREAVGNYQAAITENPRFVPARAALARLYLLGGLTDRAQELVATGLKESAQSPALLVVRAGLEAQSDKVSEALEDAKAAYQGAPDDEYAVSMLASLYRKQGQPDRAVEVVAAGIGRLPRSADLRIVLADLEAARNNYDVVERQLQEVVALEPASLAHRARLAQFRLYRKDIAGAEAAWRQAVKDLPDLLEPKLALIDLLWKQRDETTASREMKSMLLLEPDNVALKLEFGGYLQRQGKLDEAEQTFQQVLKQSGKQAAGLDARNRLAALYLSKSADSGVTQASALVAAVLAENPRDNDALILRANMALQRGDATTAITDLRSVLRDQPNSVPLQRALAKAHLQNRDQTLAEETLRSALESNPGDVSLHKDLAQLLLQQGKIQPARALLDQLTAGPTANSDPEIMDSQFRAQLLAHDYQAALQTAQRVQQLQPKFATGWYYEALIAEAQQQVAAARKGYEAALERQPEVAEPLAALVRLDLAANQNARAMQRLDQAIAANPRHVAAHNMRGELLLAARRWPDAAQSFSRSRDLAPGWWAPYRGLALAQLGDKHVDGAEETYRRGIDSTHSAELSMDLATLYERLDKPDESAKVYRQWLLRDPKSLEAANNLAMLLVNHRIDKSSLDEAARLAELLSGSTEPALLDTRGWVKFKTGDVQVALGLLRQAASGLPDAGVVKYHLGMAQLKLGDAAAARSNLQAAVKDKQGFIGLAEANRVLAALDSAG